MLLVLGIAAVAAPAPPAQTAVSVQAGTLGLEIEASKSLGGNLAGRLSAGIMAWKYGVGINSIDYDFDVKLYSLGAYLDWHPGGGGFRLTVGAIVNNHDISTDVGLDPGGRYWIGDHQYPGSLLGGLDAEVKLNNIGPYAGIGYGGPLAQSGRWSFSFDLGVVYWGSPKVSLKHKSSFDMPGLQEDLRKEEREIEDKLQILQFYPVVAVGVSYSF
jgi:hypothetical protein